MTMPDRFICDTCGTQFPVASLTESHIQNEHANVARMAARMIDADEMPEPTLKHTQPFHSTN